MATLCLAKHVKLDEYALLKVFSFNPSTSYMYIPDETLKTTFPTRETEAHVQ